MPQRFATREPEATSGPGTLPVRGGATVFRVDVPENVRPGEEFEVYAGSRIVRVRCPPDGQPGQSLRISVPRDPNPSTPTRDGRSSTSANSPNDNGSGRGAYMVTIPDGVRGGQRFPVTVQGRELMVTCPEQARPGMSVRIVPPLSPSSSLQLYEVEVPRGVQPGRPFALRAGGVRVLVTCPTNAVPGQRIRFKVPSDLALRNQANDDIRLKYGEHGWQRIVRLSDMKFQWARVNDKGNIDSRTRFHIEKSAYVRKLEFRPGDDPCIRTGFLSLVPASDAVVDSRIKTADNRDLVTYSDVAKAQRMSIGKKVQWFQDTCAILCVGWNEGHMRMNVRRQFLLGDSIDAVMSLSRKDLRKVWRFEFIGEEGMDAGGLAREWFQLVTETIFDPDMGLWRSSAVNQMSMEINPMSQFCCEDHLVYYRFLGRVIGKALFDRQLISGHMVQHLYKHILGWPVTFTDLEIVDEEYFNNLKMLQTMVENGDDISVLCLSFTTTEEVMGSKEEVELVKGGSDIEVTNDNLPEYLEACLKYRMLGRVRPQMNELLLGFYDVIPEPLLTIFSFEELELLMCGLPEIDVDDWKEHSEYSGEFDDIGPHHISCRWFWEIVAEFDQEMRARLLRFVTGTSGVPSRGFSVLQGNDGNIRKFTIHGVPVSVCYYPRAHTCFNRIDLPICNTKEELQEKLKLAVTMVGTGFHIE